MFGRIRELRFASCLLLGLASSVASIACGGGENSDIVVNEGMAGATAAGGSSTGGSNTGGSNTGGSNTGGSNTGGANTGGSNTGGGNMGGMGGAGDEPCAFGSFDDGGECVPWTDCEAGTYVSSAPSETADRVCEVCPDGTHTNGPNESECQPDPDPDPFCGDGHVDVDEQCDDGDGNGPDASCSIECQWSSEAPELYEASGIYTGGAFPSMAFQFEAFDSNADWGWFVAEQAGSRPQLLAYDDFDTMWDPDPFGLQAYEGGFNLQFAGWLYRVWLEDAGGNTSQTKVVSGVPTTQLQGETCNTGSCGIMGCNPPVAYCDVAAGDTCSNRVELPGTVKICETAVAPVLSTVSVERVDSKRYKVLWTGTDSNGDANELRIVKHENGVATTLAATVDAATPMFGATAFSSTFTATAASGGVVDPRAEITLEVSLQDWAFLGSNTITVTVPPILDPGDECTGDATVGTCWEATECLSGECYGYAPQVAGATLTYKNNGREAEVTITGYDDKTGANHTLSTVYVTIGGQTTEVSIPKTGATAPTWNGNQFTYKVTTLKTGSGQTYQVGTGYLDDEQYLQVRIVDIGGFEDTGTFYISPKQAGLGGACDVAGTTTMCHAGLVCHATLLTCVNDSNPAKVCAGVPVIQATSDVVAYSIAATGTGIETYNGYAACGASNNPNGKEAVVRYTATQDGTLVVQSAATDANVHPGYLFARVGECVDYDAIVDCSNLTPNGTTVLNNEIEVPVQTGDVVYVTVDGPSFTKGTGILTFSYQ